MNEYGGPLSDAFDSCAKSIAIAIADVWSYNTVLYIHIILSYNFPLVWSDHIIWSYNFPHYVIWSYYLIIYLPLSALCDLIIDQQLSTLYYLIRHHSQLCTVRDDYTIAFTILSYHSHVCKIWSYLSLLWRWMIRILHNLLCMIWFLKININYWLCQHSQRLRGNYISV